MQIQRRPFCDRQGIYYSAARPFTTRQIPKNFFFVVKNTPFAFRLVESSVPPGRISAVYSGVHGAFFKLLQGRGQKAKKKGGRSLLFFAKLIQPYA